jgi:hypothetical protein
MTPSAEFWNTYKGLLLICNATVGFTAVGRKQLKPRMAKFGFTLSNIKTLRRFEDVMAKVNAGERADTFVTDLDANTASLEALLISPQTSPVERAAIRRVLGIPATA